MDRREAIDILVGVIATNSEEENEALDLAIEALKAQEKPLRSDLIQRKDVLDLAKDGKIISNTNYEKVVAHINNIPSADYIPLGTFHQVRWERDTALKTLDEHGIGLGQKAESATTTDCISRQQAIEEIALHDCTNGEVPYFTGKGVQEILKTLPAVVPDFKTFCGVPIEEAIEVLEKYKHSPSVKVQQTDTLIIAAALQNFAQDGESNISDRERAEELREQVLAYGASMCQPVTPTERTGEWIEDGYYDSPFRVCSYCGYEHTDQRKMWKFCPNCGAKMKGGKE